MIHADAVLMKEIFEYRMELFFVDFFVCFFLLERLFVETEQCSGGGRQILVKEGKIW